ncbi:helix-turn-helix transcriptional regulator [Lacisediminihabitans sp.]|uniref:helix-turn-helix transcriptional regulator n=1 Tax=Lacisediminihabitans sp. TaxID=2787631 RepID=UPI00374D614B
MNERMTARLSALAAVSDPLRRALFDFVRRSGTPVSRDDAAAAVGMPRSTAAFHLDRLVDEGALAVEFKRVGGKTGPGSGRPSKLYRPASAELSASVPERDYELAGELLAAAIEQADRSGEPVRQALTRVAVEAGRELGRRAGSLEAALDDTGYEPTDDGAGGMVLTNCLFHQLATSHTEVICHANLGLLQGVAEGAGDVEHDIRFSPADGRCCVQIAARSRAE